MRNIENELDFVGDKVALFAEPQNGVLGYAVISYLAPEFNQYPRGTHNGYVIVNKDHIWSGLAYDVVDERVDVHGGLTYCGLLENTLVPENVDVPYVCFGFDTAHYADTADKWDMRAVEKETIKLVKQFILAKQGELDV